MKESLIPYSFLRLPTMNPRTHGWLIVLGDCCTPDRIYFSTLIAAVPLIIAGVMLYLSGDESLGTVLLAVGGAIPATFLLAFAIKACREWYMDSKEFVRAFEEFVRTNEERSLARRPPPIPHKTEVIVVDDG
jgi:hypothetical protein